MRVTLRYTTGYSVMHSFQRAIVIPFVPQIGMTLVVNGCSYTVKDVIWYESTGAIEVIVNEPSLSQANDGWEQVK